MCARRPTSAMPKSFLCCERAFCRSMVVMFCALKWSVLMSWCLLRGQVMWWSGHVIWCDVMACFVSCHVMQCDVMVMSCTTPVLLCTTKYYSNTTLFYKVLLQYYSVLRSTTPILLQDYSVLQILLCTTKYYSNTTPYYKYYPVLQSTTPVLPCTTKYYSVLQSTTPVLPCTTKYYSSTNLYYKVLLQYYPTKYYSSTTLYYPVLQSTSWLIRITYETSFTMRGATKGSLQLQQILRLPCKMNLMIDPHRICNVIYNARSNSQHPPTSPNTALATQNESHDWSTSHMKRHLQCAEQQSTPSNLAKYCACHAKGMTVLFLLTYATSFTMRGATGISLQPHQILRLPRKRSVMIDPHHIWNVIYNARSNRHQPPTSPNTAPATQNCTPKS